MIKQLVSSLPEIYQPIYGHPELSTKVSRSCADRLEHIINIHNALRGFLGRPVRVLDLGCAQGYFSFNLAELGAQVHGVDFLGKNIAVCNEIAQENPSLTVSFEEGRVEDAIAALAQGQYDLVLGLSVFHHIIYEKGLAAVKAMLEHAAALCGVLVIELALRDEPLYWAPAQPEDPRSLLDGIAFVHVLARHETHLAPVPRPLLVASNQYWILDGNIAAFQEWSSDPHALANGVYRGTRRYFFSSGHVLKYYKFSHPGEYNRTDFERELKFLKQHPPDFCAAKLLLFGEQHDQGWVVFERFHGRLLLDLLREGAALDSKALLISVLRQLAVLEEAGLYHNDVRTWNVIVADDGTPHLIDYGSIGELPQDCVWPRNLFLSFLIFVREVVTGVVDDPNPLRTIAISPFSLPQPYRTWATQLWHLPHTECTFKRMHDTLVDLPDHLPDRPLEKFDHLWMVAVEEAVQAIKDRCVYLDTKAQQAEAKAQQAEAKAEQAEAKAEQAEAKAEQAEAKAEQAEAKAQQAEAKAQQAEAKAQQAEAQSRAAVAEARAQQAEAQSRAAVAEARAQQAEAQSRAVVAEARAQQAEAQSRAAVAEARAQQAEAQSRAAAEQIRLLQEQLESTRKELQAVHQSNHHHWQLAEARAQEIAALRSSTSWRITAPLRAVKQVSRTILTATGIKLKAKLLLQHAALYVNRRPALRQKALSLLGRYPRLKARLQRVVSPVLHGTGTPTPAPVSGPMPAKVNHDLAALSPRARQIYADLKSALARRQQEAR